MSVDGKELSKTVDSLINGSTVQRTTIFSTDNWLYVQLCYSWMV